MTPQEQTLDCTAYLVARAIEVLGSNAAADRWLRESNPLLGNETPLALLCKDDGAQLVYDLLGRIEHGIFS